MLCIDLSGGAVYHERMQSLKCFASPAQGGNGSIIGRNTFQRPREDALAMLDTIIKIYQGKA